LREYFENELGPPISIPFLHQDKEEIVEKKLNKKNLGQAKEEEKFKYNVWTR